VVSDEPDDADGSGDGRTVADIQGVEIGTADFAFALRAERAGNGGGRTYTVTYTATTTDGSDLTTTAFGFVTVPHDLGGIVEPLMLTVGETPPGTLVEWDSLPGGISYDVVQGDVASLADAGSFIDMGTVICVESQSVDPATVGSEDPDVPSPGQAFYYAVGSSDTASYGTVSAGKPRAPTAGDCP